MSHKFPHQTPSLNHNALVARFVPVGVPVPECDGPSTPTSPGAADAGTGTTRTPIASSSAASSAASSARSRRFRDPRGRRPAERPPPRLTPSQDRPTAYALWLLMFSSFRHSICEILTVPIHRAPGQSGKSSLAEAGRHTSRFLRVVLPSASSRPRCFPRLWLIPHVRRHLFPCAAPPQRRRRAAPAQRRRCDHGSAHLR